MISGPNGSGALSFLAVFGRPSTQGGAKDPGAPPAQDNDPASVFQAVLGTPDMGRLIADHDGDHDGTLSEDELVAVFVKSKHVIRPEVDLTERLGALLIGLDGGRDPAVSLAELSAGVTRLASGVTRRPPPQVFAAAPSDKAATLMTALDDNGDGKIDTDELATGFAIKARQEKSLRELLFALMAAEPDPGPEEPGRAPS